MEKEPTRDRPVLDPAAGQARADDDPRDPKELFSQISHISICMAYDLIDKLRFWEKETLKLPPDEVQERIPHLQELLKRLKVAYLDFSDVDM